MVSVFHDVIQAVLPRRCVACGRPLDRHEQHWCSICAFSWLRQSPTGLNRFEHRMEWAFGWSWLAMAGHTERGLTHALKYSGDPSLGIALGMTMAQEWASAKRHVRHSATSSWIVVPVPLHPRRQRKRGYNQSMQLARGWSKHTGMSIASLCIRSDPGRSLTRSNRRQRMARKELPFSWQNKNALLPPATPGLIIIDDVVTTGSTLESMYCTLRKHWTGPVAFVTLADAGQ